MTSLFNRPASVVGSAEPITSFVKLVSDANIDISDGASTASWVLASAKYIGDIDLEAVALGAITFHQAGVYSLSLYASIGDNVGANLAASEPFGIALVPTGSANLVISSAVASNWESKYATMKSVGSYTLVVGSGDSFELNILNPATTADRTANVVAIIARLDANSLGVAQSPPLP